MKYDNQSAMPAPRMTQGVIGWARKNLFNGIINSIATVVIAAVVGYLLWHFCLWAFVDADWVGKDRSACTSGGACWAMIHARFGQFMFGYYPIEERWRIILTFVLLVLCILWLAIPRLPAKKIGALITLIVYPITAYILLKGGWMGLESTDPDSWGGLSLTLILSVVGITCSLPLGILLALGRTSTMPIVRVLSTFYIEVWRGVPLIGVLFMASVILPLFFSTDITFAKILRALIGITLFESAYVAEVVRAGLQALPRGQYEAADSLGLKYWQKMGWIILPQALKMMIPGLVNVFLDLFKDTSLVLTIGLMDLLQIVRTATQDASWSGLDTEGYVFAGLIFWIFCFAMSRYSQYLERRLQTGHSNRS